MLEPEFLGESPKASEGALLWPDGVVESGNARVIALKRVYEGKPGAAKYKAWLARMRIGSDSTEPH